LLEKNPNTLKVVYKAFPLPSHKMSMPAVVAAFAANRQGRFWDFYDKVFADFRNLSMEKIKQIATELKLDAERFNKDIADQQISALIGRDMVEGQQSGVRGTPSMSINGLPVENRSPQGLQEMIDRELSKAGKAK
jgi:protein-disulfide isomerase